MLKVQANFILSAFGYDLRLGYLLLWKEFDEIGMNVKFSLVGCLPHVVHVRNKIDRVIQGANIL